MQLILPLFPRYTKMISDCLGVYEKDSIVQYIANGLPIYSHDVEDLQSFRFITSNFIKEGLCKATEVSRCFSIPIDSVKRNANKLRTDGEAAFFSADKRKGYCHKIRGSVLESIQKKLDKGRSVNSIAKQEGVAEGSIRYSIRQGYLKKSLIHPAHHFKAVLTTRETSKT